MGRHYNAQDGEFGGQFWFGIQDSLALTDIGIDEAEPSFTEYRMSTADSPTLEEYIEMVEDKIPAVKQLHLTVDDMHPLWNFANNLEEASNKENLKLLSNYELALKCYLTLKTQDELVVQCEL